MLFEWDENKRQKTLLERKIDFIDMIDIWDDPKRQQARDLRLPYGEARFQTIGKAKYNIYFVVFTERIYEDGVEVIRIISARRANKKERDLYDKGLFSMRVPA
ncbi:MAG: BrnT family toxin [Spongiibacteraceae bacterium]